MLPQARRAGILLLSVYIDPSANPPWYVRIAWPRSDAAESFHCTNRADLDETVRFIREWLEGLISSLELPNEDGWPNEN
jgi:hypothetical protein